MLVSLALGKLGKLPRSPAAYAEQPARRNTGRTFTIVNTVQWVAISAAAAALSGSGHPEWIGDAVILIGDFDRRIGWGSGLQCLILAREDALLMAQRFDAEP